MTNIEAEDEFNQPKQPGIINLGLGLGLDNITYETMVYQGD